MADDENKLTNNEPEETADSKDWQWDASAPLAGEDFLDISIPEEAEEEIEEAAEAVEKIEDEADEAVEIIEEEAEDAEKEDEEIKTGDDIPEGCCIICGEKIKNSPSDCYCNKCRSKYMKVDYGATHIILSLVMIILAVVGIVAFAATSKITGSVKEADKLLKDGKISAASDAYGDVSDTVDSLNERFNAFLQGISQNFEEVTFFDSGKNVGKKQAELLSKIFSISQNDSEEFFSLVEYYFTEKELNSKKYADVSEFYDYLKKFFDDYTKINQDMQNVYTPFFEAAYSGETDAVEIEKQKNEAVKAIDKYAEENPSILSEAVEYFKYTLLYYSQQYYGVDVEHDELYTYISKAYEEAGKYDYIYFQDIASFAISVEKYDELLKASDKMLKNNPSSADAYYYKAFAYLRLEKFDEALEACDKVAEFSTDVSDNCALKANILRRRGDFRAAVDVCEEVPAPNKSSEILRQEAIAYYLAGDEENALKYAKESYDAAYAASYNGGSFSLEVVNTSALIYKLCGDDEDYEAILETLEQSQQKLEDSVMAVIKGDSTFEDLFMTGKGDI